MRPGARGDPGARPGALRPARACTYMGACVTHIREAILRRSKGFSPLGWCVGIVGVRGVAALRGGGADLRSGVDRENEGMATDEGFFSRVLLRVNFWLHYKLSKLIEAQILTFDICCFLFTIIHLLSTIILFTNY